jgi:hypothetical protein
MPLVTPAITPLVAHTCRCRASGGSGLSSCELPALDVPLLFSHLGLQAYLARFQQQVGVVVVGCRRTQRWPGGGGRALPAAGGAAGVWVVVLVVGGDMGGGVHTSSSRWGGKEGGVGNEG